MSMVTCPALLPAAGRTLFLAGGITGCADWQATVPYLLPAGIITFNPRRADWPIGDPAASAAQIAWEVAHLSRADAVLFWFTPETVQPITLYELGAQAAAGKRLAVGADPGYARRADIVLQLAHARPDVPVRDRLRDVCADAAALLGAAG